MLDFRLGGEYEEDVKLEDEEGESEDGPGEKGDGEGEEKSVLAETCFRMARESIEHPSLN